MRTLPPIVLGHGEGKSALALPFDRGRRHLLFRGRTGAGKSMLMNALGWQILRSWPDVRLVLIDPKGSTAEEWLDVALPVLGPEWGIRPEDVLVIAPARGDHGVRFNPCFAFPALPAEQRAVLIADTLRSQIDGIGERMHILLNRTLHAAVEIEGSLLDVIRLLRFPEEYGAVVARHVRSVDLREFLLWTLPEEPDSSRRALAGRLERIVMPRGTRAMLCGRGCIQGEALLSGQRVAVVDLGGGDIGFSGTLKWLGSLIFSVLCGAVLGRKVVDATPPAVVLADEWCTLADAVATDWERALSLSRAMRVGWWLADQHGGQVRAASPVLAEGLDANLGMAIHFRPDAGELKSALPLLRLTGRRRSSTLSDTVLSPAEERAELLALLGRLPPQHALVLNYIDGCSDVIRTPRLPIDELKRRATGVPEEIRSAYRRGRLGVSIDGLLGEAQLRFPPGVIDLSSRRRGPAGEDADAEPPRMARRNRPRLELP